MFFFQQIYQNKLLWIASNVILLLINIWIALKIPNSVFLRLNRVLENSRIFFWLFTFIVDSVVTFCVFDFARDFT